MKITIIFLMAMILSSCGKPADLSAIQALFHVKAASYEELTKMAKADYIGERCFSVGTDNIGKYWEYSGEWSHSNDYQTKIDINGVLDIVGISQKKYSKYLELFEVTDSERVTYCSPSSFYIMAHRSGLAVSGCLLNIVKGISPPAAYGKRNNGEDFMEIRELKPGWWMEYSCT